ncbi:hypothetical protein KKE60_07335 [Patescibacteria group bacterium]|nr:hypothetical protein [Patescibacteria group bacterium]
MKKLLSIFITILLTLVFTGISMAGVTRVTFQWEQTLPSPNDLAGWKLYRGNATGGPYTLQSTILFTVVMSTYEYAADITVPDNTETTYYFVLTAYDTSANESPYSNEISKKFDLKGPNVPSGFRLKP